MLNRYILFPKYDRYIKKNILLLVCRGCILRHFENCKTACPSCNFVYKKKNQAFFKADLQIQSIVYKVVPGLYSKEMQRREDFYRSTGVRASSSCSDDSVLERERDMINDEDSMVIKNTNITSNFFFVVPTILLLFLI